MDSPPPNTTTPAAAAAPVVPVVPPTPAAPAAATAAAVAPEAVASAATTSKVAAVPGPAAAAAAKPPPLVPYTGIPNFSLPKKLPHRNWFIFAAVVAVPTYVWYADRQEAARLKEGYLARVRALGEVKMETSLDTVRTAQVFCSRFPGEDGGFASDWFKKYLKPYLVAAAVDYTMPSVPQYTSLTVLLADKIHLLRQAAADPSSVPPPLPGKLSPVDEARRDAEGGVILVGRQSLKEYMEGLRRGWTEDRAEPWETKLDRSVFEDPSLPPLAEGETRAVADPKRTGPPINLFPLTSPPPRAPADAAAPAPPAPLPPPPSPLPPLPSVLLVPYQPNMGFTGVPRSIWGFFNTAAHTRVGGEAALAFILNEPAAFVSPTAPFVPGGEELKPNGQGGHVDRLMDDEYFIPSSFDKLPKEVDDAMVTYYKSLEKKVKTAWEIQQGRELTDNEQKYPPPTLKELEEERLKKERRARQNREGYRLLRKQSGVAWDPSFDQAFGVWEWEVKE